MAEKDLGLGVIFQASMGDFSSQLEQVKAKLKEMAAELESLSSKGDKAATRLAKSQEKVAEAATKSGEAVKKASQEMSEGAEAAAGSNERLSKALTKTDQSLIRWGKSAKEVDTALKGLGASNASQIKASELSLPVYNSLTSHLKKAEGAGIGYKNALTQMALTSGNNLIKFNQLAAALYTNEKALLATEEGFKAVRSQLGADKVPADYKRWLAEVDRVKLAHAYLNGELTKSGGVIFSTTEKFASLQKSVAGLKTKYGEAAWAATDMDARLGSYVKTVGQARAELTTYVKNQGDFTKYTTAANVAVNQMASSMDAAGKNGTAWAAGVDKVKVATAFANGQIVSANGNLLQMGKTMSQTADKVSSVEGRFKSLGTNTLAEIRSQLGKGITTWDQYGKALSTSYERAVSARSGIEGLNKVTESLKNTAGLSTAAYNKLVDAYKNGAITSQQAISTGKLFASNLKGISDNSTILNARFNDLVKSTGEFGVQARAVVSAVGSSKVAMTQATSTLAGLNKQYLAAERDTKAFNEQVKNLGKQSTSTAAFITDLKNQIQNKQISVRDATKLVKDHNTELIKMGKSANTVTGFWANLSGKLQGGGAAARAATDYFSRLGQAVGSLAAWIPAALAIGGLTQAITSSVQAVKDYDQAIKSLQAISGATDAEIGVLADSILNLSDNTKYASSELAKGAIYIAQAGFTASESLDVLKAAAYGAQGTLEPLTTAADLLTTVIRAFQLPASNASVVMDQLAVAANQSKTDLEGMRIVFNYLGPAANAAGVSLNETLGTVMALSNVGMRMSTVGTSMRQVFIGLENPSAKLRAALYELGMTVDDLSVAKMGGLVPVLQNLNKVIGGDLSNAVQFFNVRAGNAALVVSEMNEYVEMMIKYTSEYGAAAAMAGTQSEGMTVKLQKLSNQFQNFIIRLAEGGPTEVFKGMIDALSGLIVALEAIVANPMTIFIATLATMYVSLQLLGAIAKWAGIQIATYLTATVTEGYVAALKAGTSVQALTVAFRALASTSVVSFLTTLVKALYAYATGTATAATSTGVLSAAMRVLNAVLSINPLLKFSTILAAVGAVLYSTITYVQNYRKELQETNISHANSSTTALRLAESLKEASKTYGENAKSSNSYLSILKEVRETFPEITAEMVKNKESLEAQAVVLEETAKRYQDLADSAAVGAVRAIVKEYNTASAEIKAYNEALNSHRGMLDQVIAATEGLFTLLSPSALAGALVGIQSEADKLTEAWTNVKLVFSSTTSFDVANTASIKLQETMARQMLLYKEVATVVRNTSPILRKYLLESLPEGEMKKLVNGIIEAELKLAEAMKANATALEKSQIDVVQEMGTIWLDYYDRQNSMGKAAVTVAANNALAQMNALEKQYRKGEIDRSTYESKVQAIQAESFQKLINAQTKHTENVLKLEDKLYEQQHTKRADALKAYLEQQDLAQKQEIVNLGNMGLKTAEYFSKKQSIETEYYNKNKTAIEQNTLAELTALEKTYQAKVNQVEQSRPLYETDEAYKRRLADLEVENSEKLATIYQEQLTNYKTYITEKIDEFNRYKAEYDKAIKDIEKAEEDHVNNLKKINETYRKDMATAEHDYAKSVESVEEMKRDARQSTMTALEKQRDKELEFNETLEKGYKALAEAETAHDSEAKAAKIKTAKEYFDKAKGMAGSIATETKKADGQIVISAESARDKRVAALDQVGTAYKKLKETTEDVIESDKEKAINESAAKRDALVKDLDAIAAAAKRNMEEVATNISNLMTEYNKVVELFSKAIEVKVDTSKTKTELDNLKEYIQKTQGDGGFDVTVSFKGKASPVDTLENTIDSIKEALSDLATYIIDKIGPVFTVAFKGENGGVTTSLSEMISSVDSAITALSNKINSMKTVHTIVTKYVTEGSPSDSSSSSSSSSDTEGYDKGGRVPGVGNTDSVLGSLTPGEFVIRKSVVSGLGEGFFNMINSLKSFRMPKFAAGGMVPALANTSVVRSKVDETFTINLQAGSAKLPLQVVGSPATMRGTIRSFEKELSRMRLSHG